MTPHWSFGRNSRLLTPQTYLQLVGIVGLALLGVSAIQVGQINDFLIFLELAVFASLAELLSAIQVENESRVTISVGSAITLASIPILGSAGAIVIVLVGLLSRSAMKWYSKALTSDHWLKMRVNLGMQSVGVFLGGIVWAKFQHLGLPWLIPIWIFIVLLNNQINFWLLASVLRMAQGKKFDVRSFVAKHQWAATMNVLVTIAGGAMIAYATIRYGWEGVLIFYLPIFLSIYSFHSTVRHYKKTMGELEVVVAERTQELKVKNGELASKNDQLVVLNEDLTRANEANNRFLAVLSHDMRSPLTGIKLYGQLLQTRPNTPVEKRKHMMQVILQNTQTLVELVDNLVEIEQSGNNELVLQTESIDLNQLMHESAFNFDAHAAEKNIAVAVQVADQPMMIYADRQLIKRSITNLISNAIKYTPASGRVTVSIHQEADQVNVRIKDTGIGIPPDQIDKIFNSYHRVDEHRATAQGLGLGLSIVKRYIELHDGDIMVSSVVGEGSQFDIYLPLATPVQAGAAAEVVAA